MLLLKCCLKSIGQTVQFELLSSVMKYKPYKHYLFVKVYTILVARGYCRGIEILDHVVKSKSIHLNCIA